jgi:hypothetical protein
MNRSSCVKLGRNRHNTLCAIAVERFVRGVVTVSSAGAHKRERKNKFQASTRRAAKLRFSAILNSSST